MATPASADRLADMQPWHSQDRHVVRVEWGPTGAEALTTYAVRSGAAVAAVVVDVLSFTTCVSVGVDAGMRVHPYRWKDGSARAYAHERGAVLAQPRSRARTEGGISLSPSSIREATGVSDLVLPSPNGSTISTLLADAGAEVVAASLRNHRAVAAWLVEWLEATRGGRPAVVLVPAGERWPDESLRPAVEDLWGAGAVVAALASRLEHRGGPLLLSPEAVGAAASWTAVEGGVSEALHACSSGRELVEQGWPDDVAVAAEVDASDVVPVLRDGVFCAHER
jgi:2-phosphosulfolactate phosphatase